jgi:hypothetical protein
MLLSACVLCRLFSVLCISLSCHWISDVSKNAQHFGTFHYAVEITVQNWPPYSCIPKKYSCIEVRFLQLVFTPLFAMIAH